MDGVNAYQRIALGPFIAQGTAARVDQALACLRD